MRVAHFAVVSLLFVLGLAAASPALAQCRDDRGEPAPCPVAVAAAVAVGPAPAPEPVPEPEPSGMPETAHGELYVDFSFLVEGVDTRQLHFSPEDPTTVAAIAADGVAVGAGTNFDSYNGGFTVALGIRPLPWLRLPQLRLSWGYGDMGGATATLAGGAQPLTASFHDLFFLRAELGAGFDVDLGIVRLYALAHVAISGYFASATVQHDTLGSLGTDWFAEDAWEGGWTAGMDIMVTERVGYTIAYRHVHTGVESNVGYFGLHVELE